MERFYRYLCECIFIAIFAFVIFNNNYSFFNIGTILNTVINKEQLDDDLRKSQC